MRVLVACEFSGIVRDAFKALGHDAWSCDLLPCETGGQHFQRDIFELLRRDSQWDLMVFHAPCTFLANSGVRWLFGGKGKVKDLGRWLDMTTAALFFKRLLETDIPLIAGENPIPHGYALDIIGRKYDQIIQPWQFGHGETKATCLWLKGLPKLTPTNIVDGRKARVHHESPGPERWKNRSRTLQGIADAMASQWTAAVRGAGGEGE